MRVLRTWAGAAPFASYRRSGRRSGSGGRYPERVLLSVLAVVHVMLAFALIGLVLMHSGRDTGFGGLGFTPASQGGQHIVERNLTRLTVVVGILFTATTILLFYQLR
jgi:protein translocase SecG subunit